MNEKIDRTQDQERDIALYTKRETVLYTVLTLVISVAVGFMAGLGEGYKTALDPRIRHCEPVISADPNER